MSVKAEDRAHDLAQEKAAKLLKRRTGSFSSVLSNGSRKRRGYAGSISTVSFMDHHHDEDFLRQATQYENSFQLEPKTRFPVATIQSILQDVLSALDNQVYDPEVCKTKAKTLSDNIRAKVKELSVPRYKIICLVHIGELNNQGLRISSRCLWNDVFDTFASYEYKNNSLFAVASVYGVYFE